MSTNGYVHPEVLVETGWVAQHYKDANIRLVEVDVDTTAYDFGSHSWGSGLELAPRHPGPLT